MSDPTKDCPRPGLCLDLLGRVESHGRDLDRHEADVRSIRESLAVLRQDVHTLVSQSAGRDRAAHALVAIFGALLVAGLGQFGATVWWGSRLQSTVETLTATMADHEARLRTHSIYINRNQ